MTGPHPHLTARSLTEPTSLRLLLVEDDPLQADLTRRLLIDSRRPEFDVALADSLAEALKQLDEAPFDAILLDLGLPECSGFESLETIRKADPAIPIVVLTALDDEQAALESFEYGAQDYLIKPAFQTETLTRSIRYAIQRQALWTELTRLNERNQHLLRSIPSILIGLDSRHRVTQWNEAARQTLAIGTAEALGRRLEELDIPWELDLVRGCLTAVEQDDPLNQTEVRFLRQDGNEGHLEVCVTRMKAGASETETLILASDVTERKRLESRLAQSQKLEGLGQLAGGVAHEFNNLLQAIKGYTKLALNDVPEESQSAADLQQVIHAADRAATITGQLLRFSRRDVPRKCFVRPNESVASLVKILRPLIGEHIQLEVSLDEHAGPIHANSGMLEQVLMNLCLNGRDAMSLGGCLRITTADIHLDETTADETESVRPGRYVELTVNDSGCGMPSHVQARLFEPFFTTKRVGCGTGLGLSESYGMIKQHDGLIQVESQVGRGTTFRILLPAADETQWENDQNISQDMTAGGSETILVAEDDENVRRVARRILSDAGYQVVTAKCGSEAIALLEQHAGEIDLALLDVVMPGLGGYEVWERMRSLNPSSQVIFCTGYSDDAFDYRFLEDSNLRLVEKPYDPERLLMCVRELLDQRFATDEGSAPHTIPFYRSELGEADVLLAAAGD